MQCVVGVSFREIVRENRFDPAESIVAIDRRSQHCRLYDIEEQRCHQLQRHESHKQLRHHSRSTIRFVCCSILWPCVGSFGSR